MKILFSLILFSVLISSIYFLVGGMAGPVERQGCCSWHHGVCGCVDGRIQCCDGTLSPSCRC